MQDTWKAWRAFRQDPRISQVREVEEEFGVNRRLSVSALYRGHFGKSAVAVEMAYAPTHGQGTWHISISHVVACHSIIVARFDILENAREALRGAMIKWLDDQSTTSVSPGAASTLPET